MYKYLSHWSAILYWQIPFAEGVFRDKFAALEKTQFTVFKTEHRYPLKEREVHLCTTPVPSWVKCTLKEQEVVSVDFAFVQLANILEIQELIWLGMLICGNDAKNNVHAKSTKRKLVKNISKIRGVSGREKALRALQYVEDDCQSPMEALLHMALCLPYSLGGLGFSKMNFNHEIKLSQENVEIVGKETVRVDLFSEGKNIVIEYNSNLFHSDPNRRRMDYIRAQALQRQGFTVMSITSDQFYSYKHFRKWVSFLKTSFGKRIRVRADTQYQMYMSLRKYFPERENGYLDRW